MLGLVGGVLREDTARCRFIGGGRAAFLSLLILVLMLLVSLQHASKLLFLPNFLLLDGWLGVCCIRRQYLTFVRRPVAIGNLRSQA